MAEMVEMFKTLLRDVCLFSEYGSRIKLRSYQVQVARAIVASVKQHKGLSFVVLFPRQSGKNELQAQIEAYLLTLFSPVDAEIVKVSPTWKPQSYNAMRRLERTLDSNLITHSLWKKERDYIYRIGRARCLFLSGSPEANLVGATASLLLEVDEAQDVLPEKFDKDIAPMAASTNATRVFWGTAWTSRTLLQRELEAARAAEARDGVQRTFVLTATEVGAEVPAYAAFVAEQVARLGRHNPMVRTQYFSEVIDSEGGLFPPARRALMQGTHAPQSQPTPGVCYAFLLDVAGEDEGLNAGSLLANPARDDTVLTIVAVERSVPAAGEHPPLPVYRVMQRFVWTGVKQTTLYSQISALAAQWKARYVVVDATGVGAGLASFLQKALPGRVIPFLFSSVSKSCLGWNFLAVVDAGRWQEFRSGQGEPTQAEFFNQLAYCQFEIMPGPEKRMRWGVPDGTRDAASGELVHDDLVLSAALAAVLEDKEWSLARPGVVIAGADPLQEMDRGEY